MNTTSTPPTLEWSVWPLRGSWTGDQISAAPGLYRIRRTGRRELDYIGQTEVCNSGEWAIRHP